MLVHVQIGLAHWCETHGPTSILCTQVITPSCEACYPPRGNLTRIPSTPTLAGGLTPPQSSHGHAKANTTPITSPTPRTSAHHLPHFGGVAASSSSSSRLPSPSETPPASPRSPVLGPTSAASTAAGSLPEQCRNCSITLPKRFDDDAGPKTGRGVSPPGRPLRTTETVLVGTPGPSAHDGDKSQSPLTQPQFSPSNQTLATHTHTVSYYSSRSPAQASRYSHVRQACIRSLSCELVPAQTGPILFGDNQTGYTIAVVFKLSDPKSRGGLRTYALLCMSTNQRALMQSWNVIASVFQNLVHQIQHAVAEQTAKETQPPPSVGSRGPEGFLRRRTAGDGASQRSLADLVGNDRFYVDLHSAFVHLLAGLSKVHGYGSPAPPSATQNEGGSQ